MSSHTGRVEDSVQGLDTLEVWKRSKDFAASVYREVLPLLPPTEKWNLDQEIRRSVSSICANIVEGYGRYYYQENARFSYFALAAQLGYIPSEQHKELKRNIVQLTRIINGYIAYLKRSKVGADEPGVDYATREEPVPYPLVGLEDPDSPEPQ